MKADARDAANAIIANIKASQGSPWEQFKSTFSCAPGAGIVFILVLLTEITTSTLIIGFDVVTNRTTCYIISVALLPPRVLVFIWASWKVSRKNWWRYWITLDNILLLTVVISIVYGYMLLQIPDNSEAAAGALEWRIAAVASFPILMVSFNGNFRILVKIYPWTPMTIVLYKLLRVYAVVIGTVTQLTIRHQRFSGMDGDLLILYISSLVSYHVTLLSKIPSWTAWQRSMEAKAQAAHSAGVPFTLDDAGPSKAKQRTLSIFTQDYASFDEQNEDSVMFYQNYGNNPTLQLQFGTNDDSSLPVDVSTISALRSTPAIQKSSEIESYSDGLS